ncbi:TPM domain-containing protein [Brevundimonas aveniformis]|uniref:TPM domain-containing protein n=1 Tax=Brevundimonas aveniformis TaxID=370977 RepID=UPI0024929617|nr:TPM domain-containing protein [Brevundimonas aveniformis]
MGRRFVAWMIAALALCAGPAMATPTHPHVLDSTGTLFETTRDRLEAESAAIQARTGVEVFVVLQSNLGGKTAREAAQSLPLWNPSRDQIVLLLAMTERQVRVETSPGLSAEYPDVVWATLIETEMLPDLRRGRNGAAVRSGMNAISQTVSHTASTRPSVAVRGDPRALRDMGFLLVAGLLAVFSFSGARHLRIARGHW